MGSRLCVSTTQIPINRVIFLGWALQIPTPQGTFWILTVPENDFIPPPGSIYADGEFSPEPRRVSGSPSTGDVCWIKGQLESGHGTNYRHWQLVCAFGSRKSLRQCKREFGPHAHCELTRSDAADEYVWKDDTYIGQRFTFGIKPIRRNSKVDWESVWTAAKSGKLDDIPAHVRTTCYRTLRNIASDYDRPEPMVRSCHVFWGPTGTGKSRRAYAEAGLGAYYKDPRTKFWCGYQDQANVVIDEFRGGIDIAHLLRWLDRYPVFVETKGSSRPLKAVTYWITSNLDPSLWYPEIDYQTQEALLRRMQVINLT